MEPLDVLSRVSRFRWIGMGRESGRELHNVTGRRHVSTQKSEEDWKAVMGIIDPAHCQKMLTWRVVMAALNLQSLAWGDDGDLAVEDRLDLVNLLLPQSLPDVQVELIRSVERLATRTVARTAEVSVS